MPVSEEYAARTACRDHSRICTKELRGSLRGSFFSDCEGRRMNGCKFSHTVFNTKRVLKLGGESQNFVIKLDYGHGFERYGAYEGWAAGWDVIVNGKNLGSRSSNQRTHDLPKSLLLAERRLMMAGNADVKYEKVQSLCKAYYEHSSCQRPGCRYDHDLIDATRIENLGRWSPKGMDNYETLSVECKVTGSRVIWKITLKPEAFAKLDPTSSIARTIPARPFSYEGEDLLAVLRHLEGVVGVTEQSG